jgi:hypothetical protein
MTDSWPSVRRARSSSVANSSSKPRRLSSPVSVSRRASSARRRTTRRVCARCTPISAPATIRTALVMPQWTTAVLDRSSASAITAV